MDIYKDIEQRTNGEIYIGVAGPVRTGKSTFIKNFMELMVIPSISNENEKKLAMDELPQSAVGKTIMTTEPKFIPKDAVHITVSDNVSLKCRLIDCVGYMVDGAEGYEEDGQERLVKTPWFSQDIPFSKAAEIGTQKVICDHSTVGLIVTCDGSITDISRNSYVEAEERTVKELVKIGKPYIILLNSRHPEASETIELAKELEKKYESSVLPINCSELNKMVINKIFELILLNFPICSVSFDIPKWVETLDNKDAIKNHLVEKAKEMFEHIYYMKDIHNYSVSQSFKQDMYIENVIVRNINMADGGVTIEIKLFDKYYYEMLSELLGCNIRDEYTFMQEIKEMAQTKKQCEKVGNALMQSFKTGYGSVTPVEKDIKLEAPELIKSGNKYGVKIKANAPSIHLIKANITTEIAPIVGSEEQAMDLIEYIKNGSVAKDDIWSVNIFGKTIRQLVEDGLMTKINKINQESQQKLQDTMEKIVNDSNGGMVCIII